MKTITADEFWKLPKNKEAEEIDTVRLMLEDIRLRGEEAVNKYSQKFDSQKPYQVTKNEIKEAYKKIDRPTLKAIKEAARRIKDFSKAQFRQIKPFEIKMNGAVLGQKVIPLNSAGCYVPGGRYPLPSTALMCTIPAKVSGVKEVIVCSPKIAPVTIVASDIAGADKIFCIGGVQAIAAMAYGIGIIPKVDKIVGPGNKYVAAAKKQVYGAAGIDFVAGPSEVLIIADDSAKTTYIAADLLAQSEHDVSARPFLVTTSQKVASETGKEIERQLKQLSTKETAAKALENGYMILCKNIKEAIEVANSIAPEHLEIQTKKPEKIIRKLVNYGSLFIGENSAEVFGDYCSGTNHTLPTSGAARYTSGLSPKDFIKTPTYQQISKKGLAKMKQIACALATIEGLQAHKRAAEIRH